MSEENSMSVQDMRIRFIIPPAHQHIAGIKLAVDGLFDSLQQRGVTVLEGSNIKDDMALHHFHGLWHPTHAWIAAQLRRHGLPYVVSPHGMLEPWAFKHRRFKKQTYFHLVEKKYLAGAKALFVTSDMEAQNLTAVSDHPHIETIPIGCQDAHRPDYNKARKSLNWPKDEQIMLFLSRIDVKKGLDMLIQAMANSNIKEKWRLVVVGEGEAGYIESLKAIVASLEGKILQVEWIGPVWGKGRWKYLQGADLFCLPTHSENFGLAVLEALHVGTPVLTTDQTPWDEYHDVDGFFIASPNISSIRETLTSASERLNKSWTLDDREHLANWADIHFSWESIINSYIDAYQRCFNAS